MYSVHNTLLHTAIETKTLFEKMTLVERNKFNPTINLIDTTAAYDLSIFQAANSSVTVYICDIAMHILNYY